MPETKPKPAGPVETGFLKVEATPGILYRLDDGPWSLPSSAPLPLPVGPHRVTTVDTTQTVAIAAGVTSPLTLTATRGEQALEGEQHEVGGRNQQADGVFVHNLVAEYIVRLVLATRNPSEFNMPDLARAVVGARGWGFSLVTPVTISGLGRARDSSTV